MTVENAKRLTLDQVGLLAAGFCPYCERQIKGWEPVTGFCAPEWWETMRERGIDPATGHKQQCGHKEVKL